MLWTANNKDLEQIKILPLSGILIREGKAKEFVAALEREDLATSVGWLDKLKKRHNIVQMLMSGESASAV